MPNLIGQSLGRYHILEQLGEGGMATVYKAYDTRLERDVAVKVIRVDQFGAAMFERILKRFEREAKAVAKLSHPNIVKILDYGEQDNIPFLVMEFLPGGTLKQRLGKPIPWQEAVRILLPITQALAYAHEHNIVHRDIKPSNILLTDKGHPMLSDFGIAKILESEETQTLTGTGVGIGTPEYMAPEQWTGQAGPQSDLYSLGVVLYELVTGRKPYTADTPAAIMLKQVNDPLPRLKLFTPDLPDRVEKVIIKALAKKSEDRYQSMSEFATALENLTSGHAINTGVKLEGEKTKEENKKQLAEGRKQEKEETRKVPILPAEQLQRSSKWGCWAAIGGLVVLATLGVVLGIGFLNTAQKGIGPLAWLAKYTATFTSTHIPTPTRTSTLTKTSTLTRTPTLTQIPTLTQTPTANGVFTINDFAIISTIKVVANSNQGTNTGIVVTKGQTIFFIASGTWCWGGSTECSDANGTIGRPNSAELPVTLNGQYFGTLIGRIGSWYFPIGKQSKVVMNVSGYLYLLMNDRVGAYGDNSGTIEVTIGQ